MGQTFTVASYAMNPSIELNELWKVRITSPSVDHESIWIRAEVRSRGAIIYQAVTEPLKLSSGLNLIDQFKVRIRNQSFSDENMEDYISGTGRLPKGIYTGCVTIYKDQQELKTLCIEISTDNFSPPMLVQPYNGQEITNRQPLLSWIPPVPNAPSGISYSLKLTEVLDGQTPQESLLKNVHLLYREEITQTSMQYPPSGLELQVAHSYAWQIEANVGMVSIGITPVWSFNVVEIENPIDEKKVVQGYIDLNKQLNSGQIQLTKELKFKYTSFQSHQRIQLQVISFKGEEMDIKPKTVKLKVGDTYHIVNLSKVKGIRHEQDYSLIITPPDGKRKVINFTYLDPEKI